MGEYASVQLELYSQGTDTSFGGTAFSYALWVDEPYRHEKRATALLDRAEQIAKETGHKSVHLEWVKADSPEAILEWYLRRGYEVIEYGERYCLLEKTL